MNSLDNGILRRSRENTASVALGPNLEGSRAGGCLRVVSLLVVAAVRRIREVVADAAPLGDVVSVAGLEDAWAAVRAGVGVDEPVGAHGGFFVFLTILSDLSVSFVNSC